MRSGECVFCGILAGTAPASFVHEDEKCVAFLTLHQVRDGEVVIISRSHIDHFTDVPDDIAAHIMRVAQRIGRALREGFDPDRIGYLVHGYGVAHAHFIVLPQHDALDLTSARFAGVKDGQVTFSLDHLPRPTREALNARAAEIRAWLA